VRMITAFTISFEFEGKNYLALTSVRTKENNELLYSVHLYDDSLVKIFPEQNVEYSSKKPVCPSLKHPHALRLFSCINEAVSSHLKSAGIH
jgi:hypothetical protein